MLYLSATDLAIERAAKHGALQFIKRLGRDGRWYVAICDNRGVIEVADDMAGAEARVAAIQAWRAGR